MEKQEQQEDLIIEMDEVEVPFEEEGEVRKIDIKQLLTRCVIIFAVLSVITLGAKQSVKMMKNMSQEGYFKTSPSDGILD